MDKLGSFFLPPAKSTMAGTVDQLFNFINVVSALIFIGIILAIVYFVIRYRRRTENDVTSLNDHNTPLEIFWSVIPLFLIVYVFYWGFTDYLRMHEAPPNSYEINVTGRSWSWQFNYASGAASNELHVPAGQPVKLIMSSVDVLHSFYIPDFRVKHDVIPNRYTSVWFEAKEPEAAATDTSWVFCTEYCGEAHSDMITKVIIHKEDSFNKWLDENSGKPDDMPLAVYGEQLYTQLGCQTCHSLDGSRLVGPSFQGLYGKNRVFADGSSATADENYIRESILNPNAKVIEGYPAAMPSYQGQIQEEGLNAIIEFIKEQ